jgi:hypothetical protein
MGLSFWQRSQLPLRHGVLQASSASSDRAQACFSASASDWGKLSYSAWAGR